LKSGILALSYLKWVLIEKAPLPKLFGLRGLSTGDVVRDTFTTTRSAERLREQFLRDGYIVIPATLDTEEVAIVAETMERSKFLDEYEMSVENDEEGAAGKQTIFNFPGKGTLGALTRSEKIAGMADTLLGGDGVLHYFNKVGGAFMHALFPLSLSHAATLPPTTTFLPLWPVIDAAERAP